MDIETFFKTKFKNQLKILTGSVDDGKSTLLEDCYLTLKVFQ